MLANYSTLCDELLGNQSINQSINRGKSVQREGVNGGAIQIYICACKKELGDSEIKISLWNMSEA